MTQQVVLITGALTGIGRATAVAFAGKGAKVVVSGRHDDKGQDLVAELRALGAEAEFVKADVTKEDEVSNLVDTDGREIRPSRRCREQRRLRRQAQPHPGRHRRELQGRPRHECSRGIPEHEARSPRDDGPRSGSIVNISSTYGHKAAAGGSAYVSSKFAVEGLTKTVALEQGNSGIRVNAVAPGLTDTDMADRFTGTAEVNDALVATIPFLRRGSTEELANAIVFISSPEASYISGTVFDVDGGMSAT